MQQQEKNFIELLRSAIQPGRVPTLVEPDYAQLLSLGEKHAVSSLFYPALKRVLPFQDPLLRELKKRSFSAATRESLQAKELEQILSAFEEAEISILPLKGCVIKYLYPNPELRFMSDIDLLIPSSRQGSARQIMESLGHSYRKVDAGDTDVYVSPTGMNYEIHLTLEGEGFNETSSAFSGRLLELSHPKEGFSFVRELPVEEHFTYLLCHFVKHFIYGGIGIRQLIDVHICEKKWKLDPEKLDPLLEQLDLSAFRQKLKQLCEHWFEDSPGDEASEALGAYILTSGVFGTEEQRATDRILINGKGSKYFWSRLFPPFKTMADYFPILRKLPFLLPFMWIWRALRAVLFRRSKLSSELSAIGNTNDQALQDRLAFYNDCGLSVYNIDIQN